MKEFSSTNHQDTKRRIGQSLPTTSMCSKRFRVTSAQRKTEERRGTGCGRAKNGTRAHPAVLLAPFFARSLTLVPRSLLRNRTEMLATQANLQRKFLYRFTRQRPASGNEGNKCLKYFSTDSSVRAARIKGT